MLKSIDRDCCRRLRASGLTSVQAQHVVKTINLWINASGPEWTISRLKDLKQYFVKQLAGLSPEPPKWWRWNKRKGLPKGPMKHLVMAKTPQKALSRLMVYSAITLQGEGKRKVTNSQWRKLLEGLYNPIDPFSYEDRLKPYLNSFDREGGYKYNLSLRSDKYQSMHRFLGVQPVSLEKYNCNKHNIASKIAFFVKPEKRTPVLIQRQVGTACTKSSRSITVHPPKWMFWRKPYIKNIVEVVEDPVFKTELITKNRSNDLLLNYLYHPAIENSSHPAINFLKRSGMLADEMYFHEPGSVEPPIGVLSGVQQGGGKLRVFANPNLLSQLITKELGDYLYDILDTMPEDCRRNQISGALWAQEQLKDGHTMASVDLSSATDNLPAELSFDIIRELLSEDMYDSYLYSHKELESGLEHFQYLASARWKVHGGLDSDRAKTLSWSRGQPLGSYPSFAALSLLHHFIARIACNEAGVPNQYRILGDDIVIRQEAEDVLKELYLSCGAKVSLDKSITSPKLCEFAGYVITKDSIMIGPKYKTINDNSFYQFCKAMGANSLMFLRPRQKKIMKIIGFCPRGIHPLALGWNPQGLTYNERVEKYKDKIEILTGPTFSRFVEENTQSISQLTDLWLRSRWVPMRKALASEIVRLSKQRENWINQIDNPVLAEHIEAQLRVHRSLFEDNSDKESRRRWKPDEVIDSSKPSSLERVMTRKLKL